MIELSRGDIVLFADRGDYTSKPRPGVIVQSDFSLSESPAITLCGLTSHLIPDAPPRITVLPSEMNGLKQQCQIMVDRIATVRRERVRERIGSLERHLLDMLNTNLRLWLDL